MVLCNHPDVDYKKAASTPTTCGSPNTGAAHPDRLFGMGQTAMRTPEEGIEVPEADQELGLRGVMMPATPASKLRQHGLRRVLRDRGRARHAALLHILTSAATASRAAASAGRSSTASSHHPWLPGHHRHVHLGRSVRAPPKLKLRLVEADAGWVPHYMYRMDHGYDRHRYC